MFKQKTLHVSIIFLAVLCVSTGKVFSHTKAVVLPLVKEKPIPPFATIPVTGNIPDDNYRLGQFAFTVIDNTTGLEWQRVIDSFPRSYEEGQDYCDYYNLGGYHWRLPSVWELQSIVDYREAYPAINSTAFPNTGSDTFWSSTTSAVQAGWAHIIDFRDGSIPAPVGKSGHHHVRCVRSGASYDTDGPYVINDSVTVTDTSTGLEWQRFVELQERSFSYALGYCDQLSLAGGGWRLPGIKELSSLMNMRMVWQFDPDIFPNANVPDPDNVPSYQVYYWSASSYYPDGSRAWTLRVSGGRVESTDRTEEHYVLCVR